MRLLAAILAATMLIVMSPPAAAKVKPKDVDAYRALVALDKRLATTGYRLAKANAPFCRDTWRNPGWVLHSYRQYPDRETAKAAFRFPMPVAIAAVVDDGPADRAGLRAGDAFTDLPGGIFWGGERVRHRPNPELLDTVNARIYALFAGKAPATLPFAVPGDGVPRVVTLDPTPVCASGFFISSGGKADAGADGRNVRVSVKLAEFTPDEDEFAFIVAHELAHNILRHRARLDAADVKRGLGRMFGKSKRLIRQTEVEADKLALWLMVNADYKPEAALNFIERFGRKYGHGFFADGTHYRWKKRREIMQEELLRLNATQYGEHGLLPPLLRLQKPVD